MWIRNVVLAGLGCLLGGAAMAENVGFEEDFETLSTDWHIAEYDFDHSKFDTDWRRSQILMGLSEAATQEKAAGLALQLTPHDSGINRFAGASIRREAPSHYGRYDVRMKAAAGAGVVTGFFTYTGPHYGTRHDEIDIEFLGRNTRQIHLAWFVDGVLENRFIDLGFDASEKMVDYAFEWHPEKLRWFADGVLIFEHDAKDGPIPEIQGRLFVNLWAADPSIASWAGHIQDQTQAQAYIEYVRFTPFQAQQS